MNQHRPATEESGLFSLIPEITSVVNADVVLVEFVPPEAAEGAEAQRAKSAVYRDIEKQLHDQGYDVDVSILNSAEHGDYTARRRYCLVANKHKDGPPFEWPSPVTVFPGCKAILQDPETVDPRCRVRHWTTDTAMTDQEAGSKSEPGFLPTGKCSRTFRSTSRVLIRSQQVEMNTTCIWFANIAIGM